MLIPALIVSPQSEFQLFGDATEECFVCVRCGFGFPDGRVYKKAAPLGMHPFGFCVLGVSGLRFSVYWRVLGYS